MVGPFRRARPGMFTKYLGGDGVGVVTSGGEGVSGADGTAVSWTAGAVRDDGAVSAVGLGAAAGVCFEAA